MRMLCCRPCLVIADTHAALPSLPLLNPQVETPEALKEVQAALDKVGCSSSQRSWKMLLLLSCLRVSACCALDERGYIAVHLACMRHAPCCCGCTRRLTNWTA